MHGRAAFRARSGAPANGAEAITFIADPPSEDIWASRQFEQLQRAGDAQAARVAAVEQAVLELEARLAVIEADAWDRP